MAYFLDNYPISEECANLLLTEEQEKNCRVVYKLDDEGGAHIFEPWNPDVKYSDEYVVFPLRSTGATGVTLSANTKFANVINSSGDPWVKKQNWLTLWLAIAKKTYIGECVTDCHFYYMDEGHNECLHDKIYYPKDTGTGYRPDTLVKAECPGRTALVGGHIIVGATKADTVPPGGQVYILPICKMHNISHTERHRWGVGFYMKLRCDTVAAKLKGYQPEVRAYIEKHKDDIRHE